MVDQITESEFIQLKQTFELFDDDGDGLIPISDLKKILKDLGQNVTEEKIEKTIQQLGGNEEDSFDFEQFLEITSNVLRDTSDEDQLREAFRVFDKEGNGFISVSELRHFLMNIGDKMTEDEFMEMVRLTEINDDGEIQYEPLVLLLTGQKPGKMKTSNTALQKVTSSIASFHCFSVTRL